MRVVGGSVPNLIADGFDVARGLIHAGIALSGHRPGWGHFKLTEGVTSMWGDVLAGLALVVSIGTAIMGWHHGRTRTTLTGMCHTVGYFDGSSARGQDATPVAIIHHVGRPTTITDLMVVPVEKTTGTYSHSEPPEVVPHLAASPWPGVSGAMLHDGETLRFALGRMWFNPDFAKPGSDLQVRLRVTLPGNRHIYSAPFEMRAAWPDPAQWTEGVPTLPPRPVAVPAGE